MFLIYSLLCLPAIFIISIPALLIGSIASFIFIIIIFLIFIYFISRKVFTNYAQLIPALYMLPLFIALISVRKYSDIPLILNSTLPATITYAFIVFILHIIIKLLFKYKKAYIDILIICLFCIFPIKLSSLIFENNYPARIISSYDQKDFLPSNFTEKTKNKFFYLVGNQLKYNNSFDTKSKTLLTINSKLYGRLYYSDFPSPDGKKLAFATNNTLYVIDMSNNSITKALTIKDSYIASRNLQWTVDSNSFFFVKVTKHKNDIGSDGTLYKYSIKDMQMTDLILSFNPFKFATINNGREICASALDDTYYCYYGLNKNPNTTGDYDTCYVYNGFFIAKNRYFAKNKSYKPFYNYDYMDFYNKFISKKLPVQIKYDEKKQLTKITDTTKNENLLTIHWGKFSYPFKGILTSKGISWNDYIIFLPGKRYFTINVDSAQYTGPLLFDTKTSKYKILPKDIQIIKPNINSEQYPSLITKIFY